MRCSGAQVVEILKATGSPDLFSPELDSDRKKPRDPVTTDLLGALLAVSGGRVHCSQTNHRLHGSFWRTLILTKL